VKDFVSNLIWNKRLPADKKRCVMASAVDGFAWG